MSIAATQADLQKLVLAAYELRELEIAYQAGVRTIEPYAIVETGGATMLKAYQVKPDCGWRIFNTAFIESIRETGNQFTLRRPVVIRINGQPQHVAPMESRNHEQLEYENQLRRALIDLDVTDEEARKLADARRRLGISPEELRGVHYRIFSECLAAVTSDRLVSDEERKMLIDLNECLRKCGAGLIQ